MRRDKTKICVVMGAHFSAVVGGAQYQAQCLVNELKKHPDADVYYVTRSISNSYQADGYTVVQFRRAGGSFSRLFIFDAWSLTRALFRIRPHIVYQRGLKAHTGIVALYGKVFGCQTYFHVASDFNLHRSRVRAGKEIGLANAIDKRIGEYGIRHADHVITQTRAQDELLQKNFGRVASAVVANFHPVPDNTVVKKESPVTIVWIGLLDSNKRPELFAELATRFANRTDVRFKLIGRANNNAIRSKIESSICKLPNIQYLGEIPQDDVNTILDEGHVLVNTSLVEGFPNTFVQAWMRHVPVLTLGIDPDGVLAAKKVGYCCSGLDQMSDRLDKLVRERQHRESMGVNAYRHAVEKHSPAAAAALIDQMLAYEGKRAVRNSVVGKRQG